MSKRLLYVVTSRTYVCICCVLFGSVSEIFKLFEVLATTCRPEWAWFNSNRSHNSLVQVSYSFFHVPMCSCHRKAISDSYGYSLKQGNLYATTFKFFSDISTSTHIYDNAPVCLELQTKSSKITQHSHFFNNKWVIFKHLRPLTVNHLDFFGIYNSVIS